jgi:hypothetical protein
VTRAAWRGRAAWGTALLGAAVLSLAPGCEGETIVLATIAANDSGAPAASTRCTTLSDCPAGSYCSMNACGDAAGTCDYFPAHCEDGAQPVCGCDGITYFNDCLRRAAGVPASTPGRCSFITALVCGGHGDVPCPEGSRCAQLLGLRDRDCPPHDAPGTCWVVPFNCPPPTALDDPWVECGLPGGRCVDVCSAIKSGIPHRLADVCP